MIRHSNHAVGMGHLVYNFARVMAVKVLLNGCPRIKYSYSFGKFLRIEAILEPVRKVKITQVLCVAFSRVVLWVLFSESKAVIY